VDYRVILDRFYLCRLFCAHPGVGWRTYGAAGKLADFLGAFYGLATYGNAGYLREQVCKYMCPYARFRDVR
jgi:polyferredoxin